MIATLFVSWLYSLWITLPNPTFTEALVPQQSMVITDRDERELYRFYRDEDRTSVHLTDLPAHVPQAILAIEDHRFFEHGCIDVQSILRAGAKNVVDPGSQGASTISQQLARRIFLTNEKTVERKVREIMLACQMEMKMSKSTLLEHYLNWTSFGHGIAGIHQASQRFFGVPSRHLTIAQSAVLAAMLQRPTYFSPYGPHQHTRVSKRLRTELATRALPWLPALQPGDIEPGLIGLWVPTRFGSQYFSGRADLVIDHMYDFGWITESEYEQAKFELERMKFRTNTRPLTAPYFIMSLRGEVQQLLTNTATGSNITGVRVHTTIDRAVQSVAESVVHTYMQKYATDRQAHDVALLAVDRKTNEILAYVGGNRFFDGTDGGQIDMVRYPRQPGSSFKPIVYATLFEKTGKTPASVIYDTPIETGVYRAARTGYYGRMTVRTALARSRNTPAVRAFYEAGGEEAVLSMAERLGITSPSVTKAERAARYEYSQYSWPLALGAAEVSLLEMTQAYSVLARHGEYLPVRAVRTITTEQGDTVLSNQPIAEQRLEPRIADDLIDILSDESVREKTWQPWMHMPAGEQAAIKTGTSALCLQRNAAGSCVDLVPNSLWAMGTVGDLVIGVWVGNVDNAPIKKDTDALTTSVPIWREFAMKTRAIRPELFPIQSIQP